MIYYTHVNEDNVAERTILKIGSFDHLLCVAGSGERLLALLDQPGWQVVYAIDPNREALYLLELKLAALETLPVEDYPGFLGFAGQAADRREKWFVSIKAKMSEPCRQYWENHVAEIRGGVCNMGHFEQFLAGVRPLITAFLGKKFQAGFHGGYHSEDFPHFRWRLLKWLFSKRVVYWLMGNRDTAFVGKGSRPDIIPQGLQRLLDENRLEESFMAHLIFKGTLQDMPSRALPPSLQPEVLLRIRKSLQEKVFRVEYHCEDILSFLKKYSGSGDKAVFCSFSDIMSFESPEYLLECLRFFKKRVGKVVLVARTFLRNPLTQGILEKIRSMGFPVEDISSLDRTAMYCVFKIEN